LFRSASMIAYIGLSGPEKRCHHDQHILAPAAPCRKDKVSLDTSLVSRQGWNNI